MPLRLSSHFTFTRPTPDDYLAATFEFCGTIMFLTLGLGSIQAATASTLSSADVTSTVQHIMYIATAMGSSLSFSLAALRTPLTDHEVGLALLVSAWLFFRVTGAVFNPEVSLALLLCGVISPTRFVLYCVAQLLGSIAASGLVLGLTPGPLSVK
jgi:aquaporin related protein